MAKITTTLLTNKKSDQSNKYQLAIRVYHKKYIYFYFPFRLKKSDWNPNTQSVRVSHHKHAILNKIIVDRHKEIDDIVTVETAMNKNISGDRLKIIIDRDTSKKSKDFISYYDQYIKSIISEDRISYGKTHRCSYNVLEEYTGGQLPFEDMDVRFFKRLRTYFLSDKNYSKNTVYNYLGNYRAAYNSAVKEGVISQENNPFFILTIKKEDVKKTHLNISQIERLRKVETKRGSMEWKAQKCFLFSFWAAGMRISDICLMRWSNFNNWSCSIPELDYIMKKNNKQIILPLLPPAKQLLEDMKPKIMNIDMANKRVFGLVDDKELTENEKFLQIKSSTAQINRSLGTLAEKAGINEHVTFHVARHSFAGCFEHLDLPVEILQQLLAHSSISTTENYRASFGNKRAKRALSEFCRKYNDVSNG